ncbi:MAG: hypothetical protein U5K56_05420 [Halioglobus sp.]|nr:hypothetical protein [Halioglobus sp.]
MKQMVGMEWHRQLSFSRQFPTDYYLAAVLALHFIGLRVLLRDVGAIPEPLARSVRYLAGATFSIYLFHQPLLWFYSAVFAGIEAGIPRYFVVVPVTLATTFVLAKFTEHRKNTWKRWVEAVLHTLERWGRRLRQSSVGRADLP